MKRISLLEDCLDAQACEIGGKGVWLAKLYSENICLPKTICLSTAAYLHFVESHGLREKIALELNRKEFKDMRWEEIWDASLRIRNLFLQSSFPDDLYEEIAGFLEKELAHIPLAVRSSAPDEDQQKNSFAGLHDSYLNISGVQQIIHSIKKVWSSLWSDRALLYRKELALSISSSSMAVVLQQLIVGKVSGICFTQNPLNEEEMTIEAVHGLNQGLVDGDIEPDRWQLARSTHKIEEHATPGKRVKQALPVGNTVEIRPLSDSLAQKPPLTNDEVQELGKNMARLADLYGEPLDIEWTINEGNVYILQTRPITALHNTDEKNKDERSWYLSLHRSLENLKNLRDTIELTMLPEMAGEAEEMARIDLSSLPTDKLAEEIKKRQERNGYWSGLYWKDCIPFAHGIRLFGEVYNDLMVPKDPHEFVALLRGEDLLSLQRNTMIQELANLLKQESKTAKTLKDKGIQSVTNQKFKTLFHQLLKEYGSYFTTSESETISKEEMLSKVVIQYSSIPLFTSSKKKMDRSHLEQEFLHKLAGSNYGFNGKEFLELARASYRIRDDDNVYLGKIEEQAALAVSEGKRRLNDTKRPLSSTATPEDIANRLIGKATVCPDTQHAPNPPTTGPLAMQRARQLIGQPASQGVATGKARVVRNTTDITNMKAEEVLVIESIDPTMTFFAPLAAAIVEQRGGMLIHGAIIAREYGIPCITGIAHATEYIATGDKLTVDGYLGIVTVDRDSN